MSAKRKASTESSPETATFKEKIRSISFPGRGKASRFTKIRSNQKYEIEREGGQFT